MDGVPRRMHTSGECRVADEIYLVVMTGIVLGVAAVALPMMLTQRCPACGARNGLDAAKCRKCGEDLPPPSGK